MSRAAIEQLLYLYAELIDAGDFEALADLLAPAVVRANGQVLADRERAAVLLMYETSTRRYDDGTPRTRHVVTNVVVHLDETSGVATSRSTFTVYQSLPDFPLQPIIAGRYHDRFVRVHGTWRFDEREIVPELFGDLSRHLLIQVPRG
jgi:3-phenylpropionate/cinnamic acid dioxygenase small subunit